MPLLSQPTHDETALDAAARSGQVFATTSAGDVRATLHAWDSTLKRGAARNAWRTLPVNARELIDLLAGLPGVRPITTSTDGIEGGALVNGIEIARASSAIERNLRASWRRRTRGGPTPLLLIADDPETAGTVVAIGPVTHEGPLRLVSADALADVLRRASGLPALHAVRDLAEQLDHLDQTGVAGLTVKGLGTEHLFRERLRQTADWPALSVLAEAVAGSWRDALRSAGYELEELARGYLVRFAGAPVAVVHPVADVSAFAKLDAEGRPPEGILLEACRRTNADYGILAAGTRLRLFEAAPESGSAIARYLELDTAALAGDDRALLGLLTPAYLAEGGFSRLKSLVTVRQRRYSVPTRLVGLRVAAEIGAHTITIRHDGQIVAQHDRAVERFATTALLDHYLDLLAHKPGALRRALPLAQARERGEWPSVYDELWQRLEDKVGRSQAASQMIDVLLCCRDYPPEAVEQSVAGALAAGAIDGRAVQVLCRRTSERDRPATEHVMLDQRVRQVELPTPSISAYDELLDVNRSEH